MRGTKPDQQTAGALEQALSNLRIDIPDEARAALQRKQGGSAERPQQQSRKPDVVKRFEEISQAELSGTSFTGGLDRRARAQERLAQRSAKAAAAERPLNGASAIARGKSDRGRVFAGATVLDKLVSFIAFLIKSLERKLLGGIRRFLPGYRQQLMKQQQTQLQALTETKQKARQATKNGKGGAAFSGR